jgi:hypothetical protein
MRAAALRMPDVQGGPLIRYDEGIFPQLLCEDDRLALAGHRS